ncbi:methyltransferase domain-containing protein [Flavobacterium terrigena]|uniref:Methyltransferase domain-containing protein n=1 Tax=Flavobacterium terrigena TaxID=402734 RepID=A0A1H6QW23_9FLAO|nr:hypothetical protein [Flavobacterium terrigena]SEI47901.1 hypothetical protein SAMN05660918_0842 [Flavobacterium terrigena]
MDLTEFDRLFDKENYKRHPWEISRRDVMFQLLKSSEIKFPVKRIVDIGGGDAFIINEIYKQNLAEEYFTIDTAYSPEIIAQLKMNYGENPIHYVQNLTDYLTHFHSQENTLFLCMDVLEHLENEGVILNHLTEKNNYFLFAVPAFQSVFSNHDVLLGHYRRYNLKQLESVLKQYDFQIQNKGYYFTSLLLVRWLEGIFNKNKKASIDNWNGGDFKSKLITSVLKLDFGFTQLLQKIGIKIYGLSCYCICKK